MSGFAGAGAGAAGGGIAGAARVAVDRRIPQGSCVVAIDFGTSKSAYSYGFLTSDDPTALPVFYHTPHNSVKNEGVVMKADTSIVLQLNDAEEDDDLRWTPVGFGLKGKTDIYVRHHKKGKHALFEVFKMNLRDLNTDRENPLIWDHAHRFQVPLRTIVKLALQYVATGALNRINTQRGAGLQLSMPDIYWAITVPAIWSDAANGFMRQAAVDASLIGFATDPRLSLIREPEAAAFSVIIDMRTKAVNAEVAPNTGAVVVDLGGGTNDMTFINILSIEPKVEVNELRSTTGGSWGATAVDQRMLGRGGAMAHALTAADPAGGAGGAGAGGAGGGGAQAELALLDRLFSVCSDDASTRRISRLKTLKDWINILNVWEDYKMSFGSDGEVEDCPPFDPNFSTLLDEYRAAFPADAFDQAALGALVQEYNDGLDDDAMRIDVAGSSVEFPAALIETCFEPVVKGVLRDLDEALKAPECSNVRTIFLVGGFSANAFVRRKIHDFVGTSKQIVTTPAPDVSIVKGAIPMTLMSGSSMMWRRYMAYSYGVLTTAKFDPAVHAVERREEDASGPFVDFVKVQINQGDLMPAGLSTEALNLSPKTDTQQHVRISLVKIGGGPLRANEIVYCGDQRIIPHVTLKIPLNMSLPKAHRGMRVSLRFDSEVALVIKDYRGNDVTNAQVEFTRTGPGLVAGPAPTAAMAQAAAGPAPISQLSDVSQ